jgi:hypothetical protein
MAADNISGIAVSPTVVAAALLRKLRLLIVIGQKLKYSSISAVVGCQVIKIIQLPDNSNRYTNIKQLVEF